MFFFWNQNPFFTLPLSFYFPGILVGPFLDFSEYMDLVNETLFKDEKVKSKAGPGRRLPQGRKRAAYIRMVLGLVALGVFVVLGPKFNYTIGLTPEFASKSLLTRYFHPSESIHHFNLPL